MTDQIPMRSASERREAAAKALARFDGRTGALGKSVETLHERELAEALRPFLEVPEVGITEDEIVAESVAVVLDELDVFGDTVPNVASLDAALRSGWLDGDDLESIIRRIARAAVRRAERAALEHWEPADVPSQEFMLRHLGIIHRPIPENGRIGIPAQSIDKEVF